MPTRLWIVHGSHPCATIEKALELKGIPYKVVELPPPSHAVVMRRLFGRRTVPGIKFDDGEKVQGSREIMRALEQRVPAPVLLTGPDVEEAERWGEAVFQSVARRLLWKAFAVNPRAMHSFQQGQRNPKLPMFAVRAGAPLITWVEQRLNQATDETVRADLRELPAHLDHVDSLIAAGVLGGEAPNAADLQIAPTIRLLSTMADVRPLIAGRPAEKLAVKWFDPLPGGTPPGVFPAEWLPPPVPA
jgi:glutathione S-transferase